MAKIDEVQEALNILLKYYESQIDDVPPDKFDEELSNILDCLLFVKARLDKAFLSLFYFHDDTDDNQGHNNDIMTTP